MQLFGGGGSHFGQGPNVPKPFHNINQKKKFPKKKKKFSKRLDPGFHNTRTPTK